MPEWLPPLRIGFVTGATPDKWARAWREVERQPLTLVPIDEAEQVAVLAAGEVDMALVRLPVDEASVPGGLHVVRLYDEQPVAILGNDHAATTAEELRLADLEDEQLLLPHASDWQPVAEQMTRPAMTMAQAVEVAASGVGVVLAPMSVARLHHRRDVTHRPVVDLPVTTVALVWPRAQDDERRQRFVGVVRGRGARSSRT